MQPTGNPVCITGRRTVSCRGSDSASLRKHYSGSKHTWFSRNPRARFCWETTETLEEKYRIRSLIMADGPAGLRLRQSYQVDKETDSVYGTGVLGSLENGFLEPMKIHKNADTYYQYCTAFPVGHCPGTDMGS